MVNVQSQSLLLIRFLKSIYVLGFFKVFRISFQICALHLFSAVCSLRSEMQLVVFKI